MYIYKTTNLVNGKIYIGKSKKEINESKEYFGSGIVLGLAISKYGKENFKKEILDNAKTPKELSEKEIYWISKLNSTKPDIGYNRTGGGDGFSHILPETIEKIRYKNLGRKRTKDQRKNISNSMKNKLKSESHKASLRKAWEKRKIEKPHTKETLEKMSNSMKGKNKGKYIKIYEFLSPEGIIYNTSDGFIKFCKSIHIHPGCFRDLINKKRKEYHGWTYIKTIDNGRNN